MENINVQVYSLVSEPISPIEKLKTIAKLGFAGAEFTADFTEVPVEEMKKVLAENNLKVDSAHVGLDQIEGVLPYFAELGAKLVICPATNFCNKAEALEFVIRENSSVVGVELKDLRLKNNLLVGCINRGGKVLIPRGDDCLMVGDTVVVVTSQKCLRDIEDILEK